MMKTTRITLVLALAGVWLAALPVLFMLFIAQPAETVRLFEEIGAALPWGSVFIVHHVSTRLVVVTCVLAMLCLLGSEWRVHSERKRLITQFVIVITCQLFMFVLFFGLTLPCFKMGGMVCDPEPTQEASQQTD